MIINIQFKKGVLELCVLVIVSIKDCYGYELVEKISRHIDIAEGTIYPLLRRLKKEGYLESYLKESKEGPPRKYYRITAPGIKEKEALISEWQAFTGGVNAIIEKGRANDDQE
ncbi:MAG: PadR family transcriptional regulator [Halanaerobiaceae bacterium]|jgi:PadR family transcriptional regulator PadR|nr:PadR family transcriptional regulator [Halanaerobiaceae bacterium]